MNGQRARDTAETAKPTMTTLADAELDRVVGGDGSNREDDGGPSSPGDKTS